MIKKKYARIVPLILAASILVIGSLANPYMALAAVSTSTGTEAEKPVDIKDDFYAAINAKWLANAEMPADKIQIGGMADVADNVTNTLMADFDKMQKKGEPTGNPALDEYLKYYAMALDFDKRNADGAAPMLPYLDKVEKLSSLSDLNGQIIQWIQDGMDVPFGFGVMADMMDTDKNSLYVGMPNLFLPDKSYYEQGNTAGEQILNVQKQYFIDMLVLCGKTTEQATTIADEAIAFDKLMVPYKKSAQEASSILAMYNPEPYKDFIAHSSGITFDNLIPALVGTTPDQIIVMDPKFFAAFDQVINEKNFSLIKSWLLIHVADNYSSYLSNDFREAYLPVNTIMTGQTELRDPARSAYGLTSSTFSMVIGDYYGRTYFGEEAKADVTQMVDKMIGVYKQRLEKNDWLSEKTKKEALKKLDSMAVYIGYPAEVNSVYAKYTVIPSEKGGTLLDNYVNFTKIFLKDHFAQFSKPVDRTEWSARPDTVNAFYSPMNNSITFTAAILQAPLYSLKQTESQNYGGIGGVIAHEISHAFDSNGSQFDEKGNIRNWWTEADYAAFEEKTKAMAMEFDGIEVEGGKVNGFLTVTENTADAGGLSCALEVAASLENANLEEFFTNWAVVWCTKIRPEFIPIVLATDVHAPNKLRVNIQLQNLDKFFETFGIKEGDGMYRAPKDRVSIW